MTDIPSSPDKAQQQRQAQQQQDKQRQQKERTEQSDRGGVKRTTLRPGASRKEIAQATKEGMANLNALRPKASGPKEGGSAKETIGAKMAGAFDRSQDTAATSRDRAAAPGDRAATQPQQAEAKQSTRKEADRASATPANPQKTQAVAGTAESQTRQAAKPPGAGETEATRQTEARATQPTKPPQADASAARRQDGGAGTKPDSTRPDMADGRSAEQRDPASGQPKDWAKRVPPEYQGPNTIAKPTNGAGSARDSNHVDRAGLDKALQGLTNSQAARDALFTPGGAKLTIQGNADMTGSANYNKKLSGSRADDAAQYFLDKGVPKENIRTVAAGQKAAMRAGSQPGVGDARFRGVLVELTIRQQPGEQPARGDSTPPTIAHSADSSPTTKPPGAASTPEQAQPDAGPDRVMAPESHPAEASGAEKPAATQGPPDTTKPAEGRPPTTSKETEEKPKGTPEPPRSPEPTTRPGTTERSAPSDGKAPSQGPARPVDRAAPTEPSTIRAGDAANVPTTPRPAPNQDFRAWAESFGDEITMGDFNWMSQEMFHVVEQTTLRNEWGTLTGGEMGNLANTPEAGETVAEKEAFLNGVAGAIDQRANFRDTGWGPIARPNTPEYQKESEGHEQGLRVLAAMGPKVGTAYLALNKGIGFNAIRRNLAEAATSAAE